MMILKRFLSLFASSLTQKNQRVLNAAELSHKMYRLNDTLRVCRRDSDLYISCRGTVERNEWLNNLDLCLTKSPFFDGRFHNGYLEEFKDIVLNDIDLLQNVYRHDRIVFCGHSKGGCVALLLSLHFSKIFHEKDIELYTFGMPRVADDEFFREFNRQQNLRHIDFAFSDDIVSAIAFHENLSSNRIILYENTTTKMDIDSSHSIERYRNVLGDLKNI